MFGQLALFEQIKGLLAPLGVVPVLRAESADAAAHIRHDLADSRVLAGDRRATDAGVRIGGDDGEGRGDFRLAFRGWSGRQLVRIIHSQRRRASAHHQYSQQHSNYLEVPHRCRSNKGDLRAPCTLPGRLLIRSFDFTDDILRIARHQPLMPAVD